jgi:hypothetical protein
MKSVFITMLALTYSVAVFSSAPTLSLNCKSDVEKLTIGETPFVSFTKVTTINENDEQNLLVQFYFGATVETSKTPDGLGYVISVGEITKNDGLTLVRGKGTPSAGLGVLDFQLKLKGKKASLVVTLEQFREQSILNEMELTCE